MNRGNLLFGLFSFGLGLYAAMLVATNKGGPGDLVHLVPMVLLLLGSALIAYAFPEVKAEEPAKPEAPANSLAQTLPKQ